MEPPIEEVPEQAKEKNEVIISVGIDTIPSPDIAVRSSDYSISARALESPRGH
jgi:hypothetical protein